MSKLLSWLQHSTVPPYGPHMMLTTALQLDARMVDLQPSNVLGARNDAPARPRSAAPSLRRPPPSHVPNTTHMPSTTLSPTRPPARTSWSRSKPNTTRPARRAQHDAQSAAPASTYFLVPIESSRR